MPRSRDLIIIQIEEMMEEVVNNKKTKELSCGALFTGTHRQEACSDLLLKWSQLQWHEATVGLRNSHGGLNHGKN